MWRDGFYFCLIKLAFWVWCISSIVCQMDYSQLSFWHFHRCTKHIRYLINVLNVCDKNTSETLKVDGTNILLLWSHSFLTKHLILYTCESIFEQSLFFLSTMMSFDDEPCTSALHHRIRKLIFLWHPQICHHH